MHTMITRMINLQQQQNPTFFTNCRVYTGWAAPQMRTFFLKSNQVSFLWSN